MTTDMSALHEQLLADSRARLSAAREQDADVWQRNIADTRVADSLPRVFACSEYVAAQCLRMPSLLGDLVETGNLLARAPDDWVARDLSLRVSGASEAELSDLRGALKGDDKAAIEHNAEALAKVSAPVVQRPYQGEAQAAGTAPGASAEAGAGPGKDDVLDAEFEEIDPG